MTSTTTTDDGGDGTTTTSESIERYSAEETDGDALFRIDRRPPTPAEAQYQSFGPNLPTFDGMMDYVLLSRSYSDLEFYPEVAKSWDYRPGVMDITLKEDFYFWDGQNITADDVMATYDLNNFMYGGDENDAYEYIVRAEKTGDYSVRFYLSDTFREEFALASSFDGWGFFGSLNYYQSWLDKFKDAGTQSEIEKIRETLGNKEEKSVEPFFYNAFKIVGASEKGWELKLRTEDFEGLNAPQVPHFVKDINYTDMVVRSIGEDKPTTQAFLQGDYPWGGPADVDPSSLDFSTERINLVRPVDVGCYCFNASKPPMSDVHFRRAWMYMLNTKKHSRAETMYPEKAVTGFFTEQREKKFVSDSVLNNLTDYKWDQTAVQDAEREMKAGGFERGSNGNWLHKEGDNAGEPISFEIPSFSWMSSLRNNATSFVQDMNDFGIQLNHVGDTGGMWTKMAESNFDIAMNYWGGGYPANTFAINFGTKAGFGAGNPLMPDTWEGPPVGKPDSDETETYQLTTATQRLAITRNAEQYQRLVDRLTWAFNQTVPRAPIGAGLQAYLMNTTKWKWPLPAADGDNPKYWTMIPFRRPWNTGGVAYIPEDQR